MESKYKEYGCVVIATLLHGIFTYEFLGGMPYIAFGILSRITIGAFGVWMIYGIVLYLISLKWLFKADITVRYCMIALGFGAGTAIIKYGSDFGIEKWRGISASIVKIVCTDQVVTIFFGMLLMCFLFLVIAKRKIHFDIERVKVPMFILIITIISYIAFVMNYLHQNQIAIQEYNATDDQIKNLDYYFGMKILDGNVWFYVVFYIAFWWFMRRLTEKSEEK